MQKDTKKGKKMAFPKFMKGLPSYCLYFLFICTGAGIRTPNLLICSRGPTQHFQCALADTKTDNIQKNRPVA